MLAMLVSLGAAGQAACAAAPSRAMLRSLTDKE
jgi:hypothetical protein